jgi:hypothetical protein
MARARNEGVFIRTTAELEAALTLAAQSDWFSSASMMEALVLSDAKSNDLESPLSAPFERAGRMKA